MCVCVCVCVCVCLCVCACVCVDMFHRKTGYIHFGQFDIHSTKKVSPPPSIFSYISKSILPILIIQTVMNAQFSYAQIEG